jgi:hypothetical protein
MPTAFSAVGATALEHALQRARRGRSMQAAPARAADGVSATAVASPAR